MSRPNDYVIKALGLFLFLTSFFMIAAGPVFSAETLCAEVKIEIRQEVTLERQAFDAHMRINNGLTSMALENVAITVQFTDKEGKAVIASSDPTKGDASFFIRVDTMDNIEHVDGSGVVRPSSTADIHWLIIPTPGASGGLVSGKRYNVGATLTYTLGGKENKTGVNPDYIFVKPMPDLVLDYFLPTDVHGDDPLTEGVIESVEPFTLGVRVKNTGKGLARNLKIESAQPKIVENKQGLLIGYIIKGCEVGNKSQEPTLLADFGNIDPNGAVSARWTMTCNLSGTFKSFTADFSHSDELGGELTSLIDSVNTHFLVRDVIADLPGRDDIRDFLTKDKDTGKLKIFESDGTETSVTDISAGSALQQAGLLSVSPTSGYVYARLQDPFSGLKRVKEAQRSDGKRIPAENVWFSRAKNADKNWEYFLNIFDVNTTGKYTLVFENISEKPLPPNIQLIPDTFGVEGQQISFLVQATDPNGTVPVLGGKSLPAGAVFTDNGNGNGIFSWTPAVGQAGRYKLTLTASDGKLTSSQNCNLIIRTKDDTDGDLIPDAWEMKHFGNLDRDGSGDFDGDGISDLDEFLLGSDPGNTDNVPGVPLVISPDDGEVTTLRPALIIKNSIKYGVRETSYEFEIYGDEGFNDRVAFSGSVAEGKDQSSWTLASDLQDNHKYYFRVRATNGSGYSLWNHGNFFVNTENDAPELFQISAPASGRKVDTLTPVLEINNPRDKDRDALFCIFRIYSDKERTELVLSSPKQAISPNGSTSWIVASPLKDLSTYYLKVAAEDIHGVVTEISGSSFTVDLSGSAPEKPVGLSPASGANINVKQVGLSVSVAGQKDTSVYVFELDVVNTFDSSDKRVSTVSPVAETAVWQISDLTDDVTYHWRVKVVDGDYESIWSVSSFFVSEWNGAPSVPVIKNPGDMSWVRIRKPVFSVHPSMDPESDSLEYQFELFSDEKMNNLVADGKAKDLSWKASVVLADNTRYFVRTVAKDEHGLFGRWSSLSPFFIRSSGVNTPPSFEWVKPAGDMVVSGDEIVKIEWKSFDPDSESLTAIYYDTDQEGNDGTAVATGLGESISSFSWDVTELSGVYYLYAAIKDESSTEVIYNKFSVTVNRDSDGDGIPDHVDLFPRNANEWADNDGDGIGDNTDPDDDNDSLPDEWEIANGLNSKSAVDATLDKDEDGFSNIDEYLGGSDPSNAYSVPSVENFESGDMSLFSWSLVDSGKWKVVDDIGEKVNPHENNFNIVVSPDLGNGESSSLSVKMLCEKGVLSFGYALNTVQNHGILKLYMDDSLLGEWSGVVSFTRTAKFNVPYGMHVFRWEFVKDSEGSAGMNRVWIDEIQFPMSRDSDQDQMPDRWEAENSLNLKADDASADRDGDGYANLLEFTAGTSADDSSDHPQTDAVTDDFESGNFSSGKIKWHLGGDTVWRVSAGAAHQGSYSADSPMLAAGESAFADIIRYCDKGSISFMYMTDTTKDSGVLEFFIDDILKGSWSGSNGYTKFGPHAVDPGVHTFRWNYKNAGSSGIVRIDSINITGHIDGDRDLMPDGWEVAKGMNPLASDADGDVDLDGISNWDEYLAETTPSDHKAPNPNPAGFATVPVQTGKNTVTMTAVTATDDLGVQYFFEETGNESGGSDSGWQNSPVYTDGGLKPGTKYIYRVKVRDKSANYNETGWSGEFTAVTEAEDLQPPKPNPAGFATAPSANDSKDRITMKAITGTDPSGVEYFFDETSGKSGGSDSGWQKSPDYVDTGLSAGTKYTYRVKYRDLSPKKNESSWSASVSTETKSSGCGAAPVYRDGVQARKSPTDSLLFAVLPLLPCVLSLCVWYVVIAWRKRREE